MFSQLHLWIHQKHWTDLRDSGSMSRMFDSPRTDLKFKRKFLRALHPKWRAKVTAIEESKYLLSLALDELIGNLKVHEVVMEKDSKIYRGKNERVKSIALKAKKESSDDETSTSGSNDEEYAMAIRNFKKFFRRKDEWIKDSGCSEHMTGNKSLFSTYKAYDGCNVVFGINLKGKIICKESLNVTFDESPPPTKLSPLVDDDVGEEEAIRKNTKIYVKEMLKKFGLEDSKPTKTPMSTKIKLTKDDEVDSVDRFKYQGTKMPSEYQQDYKKTCVYAPKIYNDPNMSDTLRDIYWTLESRYVHEGRTIDPSFYSDLNDDSVAKFTAIVFDCLLSLDEKVFP
nr:alpha/beta hydrolases superfamily protein [Tanacetum cinerariifolium]